MELKQYMAGGDKGYLIKKNEVDEKLRQSFDTLKDKRINSITSLYDCYEIKFEDKEIREEKGDHYVVRSKSYMYLDSLYVKKELLNRIFGIQKDVHIIRCGPMANNRFYSKFFSEITSYDDDNSYYFLVTGDLIEEYFDEVAEIIK